MTFHGRPCLVFFYENVYAERIVILIPDKNNTAKIICFFVRY